MKVFITGGTGWIGSGIIRELVGAKHEVIALARTSAGAEQVATLGATPRRGDLTDRIGLREAAREVDAAIHCAFNHVFSPLDGVGAVLVRMTRSPWFARASPAGRTDLRAIEAITEGLAASSSPHKAFLSTSGIAGLKAGQLGSEADRPDPSALGGIRIASEQATLAAARKGVRSAVMRLPPSVHGKGDHGFVSALIEIARRTRVSGYVGTGENRWSAVHRDDAALLYRLALEGLAAGTVPAGSVLHGVAEQGIPFGELASAIARQAGVESTAPVKSGHFGMFLGMVAKLDIIATSEQTRRLTGWNPTRAGLLEDIRGGAYAAQPSEGSIWAPPARSVRNDG